MAVAFAKSGRDGVPSPSVAGGRRWNADPTEMVGGGGALHRVETVFDFSSLALSDSSPSLVYQCAHKERPVERARAGLRA